MNVNGFMSSCIAHVSRCDMVPDHDWETTRHEVYIGLAQWAVSSYFDLDFLEILNPKP